MSDGNTFSVFVSYPDGLRQLAGVLKAEIEASADSLDGLVFIALDNIRTGSNWEESVRSALLESDLVVFLWSEESFCSMGQLVELGACWVLNKKRFGVCYGVEPGRLPPYLNSSQAIMWADRRERFRDIF